LADFKDWRPEISVNSPKFGLLTQTDVVRFFLKNLQSLGPVALKTVADLGFIEEGQSPLAIPSNIPLVEVLCLMRNEDSLRAIAVVEAMDGDYIGFSSKTYSKRQDCRDLIRK
jgi:hypothetical protein